MTKENTKSIKIDLNQFKLHIFCKPNIELTLHFNSPSRKFYLSVIALVINEMKRKDKIKSVPLQNFLDELILLNKTIGKGAGSSKKEHLLPRIYRKWKDALPDLENAPLFKVVGKKKKYDDLIMDKVYIFSDEEKDCWANLFEYMGSDENVRLRFSVDKLLLNLEDVVIVYGETQKQLDGNAWKNFLSDLKSNLEIQSAPNSVRSQGFISEPKPKYDIRNIFAEGNRKRLILFAVFGLILILITLISWQYIKSISKVEVASIDKMTFPLPEKPSIAVLPFDNMSGDPEQNDLADAVTENIISGLALVPEMLVISRYSMFTYKGKTVKVQQVSEDLGVRYVLEGSIHKNQDSVRISAQLIDALSGHHIWANHYDRDIKDLFTLLDEITKKITVELQVELTHGDMAQLWHKTENFEAWGLAIKAWSTIEHFSRENVNKAQDLAQRAVQLDPMYGFAWSLLAYTHFYKARIGWSDSPPESYKKAVSLNLKALELDNTLWCATAMLGSIKLFQGRFEEAIDLGEKSISLGPGIAINYPIFAQTLFYAGRFKEAIAMCKKGIRLQPYYPAWYLSYLGLSYRLSGNYNDALKVLSIELDRAKKGEIYPLDVHLKMADVYCELGEYKKANFHINEVLKLDANYSIKSVRKRHNHFKDPSYLEVMVNSLRTAGLPE